MGRRHVTYVDVDYVVTIRLAEDEALEEYGVPSEGEICRAVQGAVSEAVEVTVKRQ